MSIDDYYVSRITLNRLDAVFQNGFMTVFELIAKSPELFNNTVSADELFKEFVDDPIKEIKENEKEKKDVIRKKNNKLKKIKMEKHQIIDINKCHALIHLDREFRQCQKEQLSDDDFCTNHSKLDVLPYGRVNFFEDDD
jgi:hypothetical protein